MSTTDPFWAQKQTEKQNKERILSALFKSPLTFTELKRVLGFSKPTLSKHLKSLKEQEQVTREIIDDKVVYKLTKGAFNLPLLHSLFFFQLF